MNGNTNLQMFMAPGLAMVTTKQPPGKDSLQLHLWRQWPGQTLRQHHSRVACSSSCKVQHRECSLGRNAPGMFLTPGEATAENPAVCEDAEPDLAGCVHAVGVHPKVIYEALHLNLQMPWGNSVLHSQAGARSSEHGSERRWRLSRAPDSRDLNQDLATGCTPSKLPLRQ